MKVFMKYEADDMPVVYFYEVDTNNERYAIRAIEVFVNRQVKIIDDLYRNVIEVMPVPTVDDLNSNICGEGFYAMAISKYEFDSIWNSCVYDGELSMDNDSKASS